MRVRVYLGKSTAESPERLPIDTAHRYLSVGGDSDETRAARMTPPQSAACGVLLADDGTGVGGRAR